MIEEKNYGYRDKKGHFVPNEAAEKNPLWLLPLNIRKIINWFLLSYIFSWNLVYFLVALLAYYFFTPSLAEMQNLSPGWIVEILLRNWFFLLSFERALKQ